MNYKVVIQAYMVEDHANSYSDQPNIGTRSQSQLG